MAASDLPACLVEVAATWGEEVDGAVLCVGLVGAVEEGGLEGAGLAAAPFPGADPLPLFADGGTDARIGRAPPRRECVSGGWEPTSTAPPLARDRAGAALKPARPTAASPPRRSGTAAATPDWRVAAFSAERPADRAVEEVGPAQLGDEGDQAEPDRGGQAEEDERGAARPIQQPLAGEAVLADRSCQLLS